MGQSLWCSAICGEVVPDASRMDVMFLRIARPSVRRWLHLIFKNSLAHLASIESSVGFTASFNTQLISHHTSKLNWSLCILNTQFNSLYTSLLQLYEKMALFDFQKFSGASRFIIQSSVGFTASFNLFYKLWSTIRLGLGLSYKNWRCIVQD